MNVYSIVEEAARKWPSNFAVHEDNNSYTFSELYELTELLQQKLKNLGLGEGMGLGVMMRNSSNFIVALLAGIACKAVIMPVSHQLKQAELDELIQQAGLHAILDDFSGISPEYPNFFELESDQNKLRFCLTGIDTKFPIAPCIKDAAFMRFTSGTTGKSKGVIVSHQSTIERIEAANKALQLGPGDAVVWVLPMAYHFLVSIILYLRFGACILICKDFLAATIIEFCNKHQGTLLYASPLHIRLLTKDQSKIQMPSLKRVISTSTAISIQQCEEFKKRFGIEVSQAYGIIEIGLPIINLNKSLQNPDAVGHALPDYQVEILDKDHVPLPPGQIGKLGIKGPGMFDAYLTPFQMRESVLINSWFLTGDLAIKSKDGLITICGREKSMINVSGNKVFPEEVEHVLLSHPFIKDCKIMGTTHVLLGEIVEAKIVLESNCAISIEEIMEYCRMRLSTYKVPQFIEFVSDLEQTASGKIKRN
jgi:long-chain acyl-CoA synthetase